MVGQQWWGAVVGQQWWGAVVGHSVRQAGTHRPGADGGPMSFGTLAIIAAAGLIGPLFAVRSGWNIPVVLGELVARAGSRRERVELGAV